MKFVVFVTYAQGAIPPEEEVVAHRSYSRQRLYSQDLDRQDRYAMHIITEFGSQLTNRELQKQLQVFRSDRGFSSSAVTLRAEAMLQKAEDRPAILESPGSALLTYLVWLLLRRLTDGHYW